MKNYQKIQKVILDSLSEGIITMNSDFEITYINQAAQRITGFKLAEAIQKKCNRICNSPFCKTECPVSLVLKTDRPIFDFESQFITKNGREIPVKLNAAILKNDENEPIGGVISFRDANSNGCSDGNKAPHESFFGIIGRSKIMQELYALISEISASDASVLIQGETGSGKELVANAIQCNSNRASAKFVKVNCSVLPPALLASELFGHCRGAFTDAKTDRKGRFEMADKGSIFLDEIGEIPLNMQSQLLRILQDGSFERLGETRTRYVDVRVIAATNKNLEEEIRRGHFREDLFYRLNVIPIKVPPLRERMADLPLLVAHFIKKNREIYHRAIADIDDDAFDLLMQHHWPGNVRELENVIEFGYIRSKKNNTICNCGLPPYLRENIECEDDDKPTPKISQLKREKLLAVLEANNWNQSKAAEILGVNRSTIWRKLKSLGVKI